MPKHNLTYSVSMTTRKIRPGEVDGKDYYFVSKEDLYKRLRSRGTESEEIIEQRVQKANREFKKAKYYDYIVVNDDVDNAADRILAIIRAEHATTKRSIHKYYELIGEDDVE